MRLNRSENTNTLCPKKETKVFSFVISLTKNSGDSDGIWIIASSINLLKNDLNVFHLTWVIRLQKETTKFIRAELWPDNSAWEISQEKVYKTASLIWSYQRCHWRMAAAMMHGSNLAHSVLSRCFISSWLVTCLLYTFSCNSPHSPTRCNELDSNLENLENTVEVRQILEFLSVTTQW